MSSIILLSLKEIKKYIHVEFESLNSKNVLIKAVGKGKVQELEKLELIDDSLSKGMKTFNEIERRFEQLKRDIKIINKK